VRWIENWPSVWAQRVVISDVKCSWRLVTCVPQGLILVPILINISMNDLDGRVEFTLSKFSGDTKAGGVADILVVCAAIQRDLKNLEK